MRPPARSMAIGGLTLGSAAAPSIAQIDGTGTWLWDVTTQDGDAIVEPGETATVTLTMLMETAPPYDVVGIGVAIFDTLGVANAAQGHITGWQVLSTLDELTGDTTTSDGVNLFNTQAGQLTAGGFNGANPIDVFEFTWAPDAPAEFAVTYATFTEQFGAWVSETGSIHDAVYMDLPAIDAEINFQVVPTPPTALALLALTIPRRGRRRPQ